MAALLLVAVLLLIDGIASAPAQMKPSQPHSSATATNHQQTPPLALSKARIPLHKGPIEIAPAPNMGMINFLYTMGKIAIAKAKSEKESPNIYRLVQAKHLVDLCMEQFEEGEDALVYLKHLTDCAGAVTLFSKEF